MATQRSNQVSKKAVNETIRLYSEILSKPLNESQLMRPTFGLMQEIVKSLITETRTLRNVFNPSDFNPEKKDTRSKTEFVQKLIDFAANHEHPIVGCVAVKLVNGLEPNKINELLQSLALIAKARLNGKNNVPNRPRTFTKQASIVINVPVKGQAVKGLSTKATINNQLSNSNINGLPSKLLAGDVASEHKPRNHLAPGPNKSSANSRRLISSHDQVRSSMSSKEKVSTELSHKRVKKIGNRKITQEDASAVGGESVNFQSSAKSSSSSSHHTAIDERNVNEHIQQLRYNLEQVQSSLFDLSQFEVKLKKKLSNQFTDQLADD